MQCSTPWQELAGQPRQIRWYVATARQGGPAKQFTHTHTHTHTHDRLSLTHTRSALLHRLLLALRALHERQPDRLSTRAGGSGGEAPKSRFSGHIHISYTCRERGGDRQIIQAEERRRRAGSKGIIIHYVYTYT